MRYLLTRLREINELKKQTKGEKNEKVNFVIKHVFMCNGEC